jgi:hypothetical protein
MRVLLSRLILGALLAVSLSTANGQTSKNFPAPIVRPAIDGILAGFQSHPLVAIGNYEDYAQEEDFYAALIRDPRFAREVGNVVVEFGSAAHQNTIDRYLNGEDVSFSDLRKVWSDVVGFNIPYAIGYINFFTQVREVNHTLPANQRIHVWLGEPLIDWSKIKTKAEFVRYFPQRDTHPAEIVEKEILARNKRALIIYGDGHFYAHDAHHPFLTLVEQKHPNALFIVEMYTGYVTKSCTADFEHTIESWPTPALATPVSGSSLAARLYRQGCDAADKSLFRFPPSMTEAQKSKATADIERIASGVRGDALLFLGKAASLTQSPYEPSIYLDPDYRWEMNRRVGLGFEFEFDGSAIGPVPMTDSFVQKNPASPRYIHHY